jgi:hypothetical protein
MVPGATVLFGAFRGFDDRVTDPPVGISPTSGVNLWAAAPNGDIVDVEFGAQPPPLFYGEPISFTML